MVRTEERKEQLFNLYLRLESKADALRGSAAYYFKIGNKIESSKCSMLASKYDRVSFKCYTKSIQGENHE